MYKPAPVTSTRLPPRTKEEIQEIKDITGIRATNEVIIQAIARWIRELRKEAK